MAFRTVLFVCALAGIASAADRDFVNTKMFSPDGIRSLTAQMRAAPELKIVNPEPKMVNPGPHACSIPLLEMHAKNPDPKIAIPFSKPDFDHIAVPAPAPACKGWNKER